MLDHLKYVFIFSFKNYIFYFILPKMYPIMVRVEYLIS